jgi:hypothetical protein
MTLCRGAAAFSLSLFVCVGCSDGEVRGGPGTSVTSASGATSASAVPGAAGPSAVAFDAKSFCDRLCKRSAECGLKKVEELAKTGDAADVKALEKAKTDTPQIEKTCVEACAKDPPTAADDRAKKADACLTNEKECGGFESCVEAVAAEK